MSQNSLIQIRVDEATKKEADALFSNLGLDTPTAVRIFLKQALKYHGLPFAVVDTDPEVHLPRKMGALDMTQMTKEQFDSVMQNAWDSARAGRTISHEEVMRKYGL